MHVSLADLIGLDGSSALMGQWTARVRAAWAAHRAAASVSGSDGGAWLDGDPARAFTCDASLTPVVTGDVNPAALDELVRLCAQLGRLHHHSTGTGAGTATATATAMPRRRRRRRRRPRCRRRPRRPPAPAAARSRDALEQAIIGAAVDLVSGPGGLAGFLRRRQLGARLGGPSLPLDVGASTDIPAAIRRAVILRDQHCRFPGGCFPKHTLTALRSAMAWFQGHLLGRALSRPWR